MRGRRDPGAGETVRRVCLLLASILCAAGLIVAGGHWLEKRQEKPETRGDYHQRYAYEETIEVDGVTYRRRAGLTSVLLMGIDRAGDAVVSGYRNGGQSDFLRLMVIDSAAKRITQLQIDRDTMTPITILGVLGNQSGVRTAQVCLSHGFGNGREQSCELTRDAVSNLLLGTRIDFYASMNLDGISVLNDWAGGVTVTLEDDFSALDPTMTAGQTLTLMGDQAEYYVRSRMNIGVGTNEGRMKRQQQYIAQLSVQLGERMHESQETIGSLYDTLEPYLITDLSRGRLINEAWAARDYETRLVELPGSYGIGSDGFMEFWPDEAQLKRTVLELCYEKVE